MSECRYIRAEENPQAIRLSFLCFLSVMDEDLAKKLDSTDEDSKEEREEDYKLKFGHFNDDGVLDACVSLLDFKVKFDGHDVGMVGVQGVISAPETRGSGAVTKLLNKSLRMIKEQGNIFSGLYPFSYSFYRRFGYELAYQKKTAVIPVRTLSAHKFPKNQVKHVIYDEKKPDSIAEIRKVYENFSSGRNHAIVRDDERWNEMLEGDPYQTRKNLYLIYNKNSEPCAYVFLHPGHKPDDDKAELIISELAYTDKQSLYDTFGFLAGLSPQFGEVKITSDLDFQAIFPEAWDVSVSVAPSVMWRVIDVEKAVELMRPPESVERGAFVMEIRDDNLEENSGKYLVNWENGKVGISRTNQTPALITSIQGFTQLATGFLTPEQIIYRKDTELTPDKNVSAFFYKKPLYIWEHF